MITAFVRTIILYFLIVDLRPGRRAHAGLRHSAALWPAADPDAAGPVTAAESAVSPQPAAAGADLRDAHGPDPGRQAAAGRHAEEPLYHR